MKKFISFISDMLFGILSLFFIVGLVVVTFFFMTGLTLSILFVAGLAIGSIFVVGLIMIPYAVINQKKVKFDKSYEFKLGSDSNFDSDKNVCQDKTN